MEERNRKSVIPEDGYEWRKYGQKFIKKAQKYRSYFKCQKKNCGAKKRVEWSSASSDQSEPPSLRVVYDGVHTHAKSFPTKCPSQQDQPSTSTAPNAYNLLTQVFEDQATYPRHA